MIIGLSPDEEDHLFDGQTCVISLQLGVVFYDGPEHHYTRPTLFVGPDGEPMRKPIRFAKEWRLHAIGEHYFDPLWEAKFRDSTEA